MRIYCEKVEFGHIPRSFSSNSALFSSKDQIICLKSVFFSLRFHKSDRLLAKFAFFVQDLLERLLTNWQGSSHTDVLRESL